jgi:hypothetical protein
MHDHAPSCIVFFSQHAVICDHCRKIFLKNGAFLTHEKQCPNRALVTHPDLLKGLSYIDSSGILGDSVAERSLPPSAEGIMKLKVITPGDVQDHYVVRALLPYADPDYAIFELVKPTKQYAVLPNAFKGDYYAGKKHYQNCHVWYPGNHFFMHQKICHSIFHGIGTLSRPHARCPHFGEHFRRNGGFQWHLNLCKQNATKDSCPFCQEIFLVKSAARNDHVKHCHNNPNRATIPIRGLASLSVRQHLCTLIHPIVLVLRSRRFRTLLLALPTCRSVSVVQFPPRLHPQALAPDRPTS